jgi:Flp pilus assembly pilin Flp
MTTTRKTRRTRTEGLTARLARWFDGGERVEAIEGQDGLPEQGASFGQLVRDSRGAIFVEYVALLTLVTVGGAAAVVTLGAPLVALARFTQLFVGLPIP